MTESKQVITPSPEYKTELKHTENPTFTTKNIWVNGHLLQVYNVYVVFYINVRLRPEQQEKFLEVMPSSWSGKFTMTGEDKSNLSLQVPLKDEKETKTKRIKLDNKSNTNEVTVIGSSAEGAIFAVRRFLRVIQQRGEELKIAGSNFIENDNVGGLKTKIYEPKIVNYKVLSMAGKYTPPIEEATKDTPDKDRIRIRIQGMTQDGFEERQLDAPGPPAQRKNIFDPKDASKKLGHVAVFVNGKIEITGSPSTAALAQAFEIVQSIIPKYARPGTIKPFSRELAEIDSAADRLERIDIGSKKRKEPPTEIEQRRRAKRQKTATPSPQTRPKFKSGSRSAFWESRGSMMPGSRSKTKIGKSRP